MRIKLLLGLAAMLLLVAGAYWLGVRQSTLPPPAIAPQPSMRPSTSSTDPYIAGPVKNTLRKQASAMQQLWLVHLAKPDAKEAGFVEIDWRINREGNAEQVGVIVSTLDDKVLEDGLVRIIAGLNFPAPDSAEKYVAHKFKFKKEDSPK